MTIAIVFTTGSETVPSTAKRGLLTIRSATRTATVVTATVVIRAIATISATIRTGSIATRTVCISRKAFLAPM